MKNKKLRIILIIVFSLILGTSGFYYGYSRYELDNKKYVEKLQILSKGFSSGNEQSILSALDQAEISGGPAEEPKLINYVTIPTSIGFLIGVVLPFLFIRVKNRFSNL